MNADIMGSMGALLTTIAFVPQAVRVIRTDDTAAISLTMYAVFVVGVAFWLAFGLMIASGPIIAANAVTLLLASIVLIQKIRHTVSRSADR